MLTVVRSVQESVIVAEDDSPRRVLKVTILGIQGNQVKLGFEVDSAGAVHRWETWERILDGRDSLNAQLPIRTAFTSWLNRRAHPVGKVEVLNPQEEVATHV